MKPCDSSPLTRAGLAIIALVACIVLYVAPPERALSGSLAVHDAAVAAEEVSGRGLPGDVYRAATIRTGRFVR